MISVQEQARIGRQLTNRSDTAIERKHQNVSACLIDLGFPYIDGYKPLGNYQGLLYDVVADRLRADRPLRLAAEERAGQPAIVPAVDDILSRLVEVPGIQGRAAPEIADRPSRIVKTDYLALEARNQSLGSAGEEFAIRFEQARLTMEGSRELAGRVERVSTTRGESEGYDVLSFEASGRERLIEVKTTSYGESTPFLVTPNEIAMSADYPDQYFVYRLFRFRDDPRMFMKAGEIGRSFNLTPSEFLARLS